MKRKTKEVSAPATSAATTPAPTAVENAVETPVTEPVQLTVQDLQLLARIVDLASRRGAFQAAELSQVGESYNKLASFLSYVESVNSAEKTEEGVTE